MKNQQEPTMSNADDLTAAVEDLSPQPIPILTAFIAIAITFIVYHLLYNGKSKRALHPEKFTPLPLVKKESLTHNTRRFTFALPNGPTGRLGLPVGQHISLKFTETLENGSVLHHVRTYTPTTGNETLGLVKFVIKVYKAGVHPNYPEGGKMSQYLDSLKIGDTVEMRGPKGKMTYHKNGRFTVHPINKGDPPDERMAKHFGMIAGGTGITPMLQMINAVLDEPESDITISLLYANKNEEDIIMREELDDALIRYWGGYKPQGSGFTRGRTTRGRFQRGKFKVHYTLDQVPPGSGYAFSSGHVDKDMIEAHLPGPESDGSTQILLCGPKELVNNCVSYLDALGFKKTDYFVF